MRMESFRYLGFSLFPSDLTRLRVLGVLLFCLSSMTGCYRLGLSPSYEGPVERPSRLNDYYSQGESYYSYTEEVTKREERFSIKNIVIESSAGTLSIDYYYQDKPSDDLILVFPVLGGRPVLSAYFAHYFAEQGYDAAIIARVNDFKDKSNFLRIEEILRRGVVRDRIALDFFEKEYGKKDFGTFGMSRGGINVAISAGIDPRLRYNVIVMGGSGLVDIFENSKESRVAKFVDEVAEDHDWPKEEMFRYLRKNVVTDPQYLAKHVDAKNTLLMISTCDNAVPYTSGLQLREEIGRPETIVLMAGHKTSVFFTQFLPAVPPLREACIFPFGYVELEALHFFNEHFDRGTFVSAMKLAPFRLLQFMPSAIARFWTLVNGTL